MRILYISHTHPPKGEILDNVGGMQRVSQQLVRELKRKDSVEVSTEAISASGDGRIVMKTIRFLIRLVFQLPYRVRECEADVVLFSSMVTASLAYFVSNRVSVPLVTINHGRDVTLPVKIYQWFVPKIFNNLDGVISVSRATREECIKRGMDPQKGVALPNGFDFQTLNNFPDKVKSRNRLQKNFRIPLRNNFMLLTVGRKVERKGHEWFIREVLPKIDEQVVYVTIGDGPEFDNIKTAADESSKSDRIFLLGRQPDEVLKQAYAAADLFIMPNVPVEGDMEGFGIVLLEANTARTPAVAADLEGIKDVIAQGKNGYRVPPLNASEFAEKIYKILSNNLEPFSEQTRNYVLNQFSWKQVAQQYIDFLATVINRYNP